jgi:predicted nucleic acid binding AN1-type Zn finger protein
LRKIRTSRYRKLKEHKTIKTKKKKTQANSRYIIIKTLNIQNKERILKAAKEKRQVTYKGKPIRITADFSTQTLNIKEFTTIKTALQKILKGLLYTEETRMRQENARKIELF